MTRNPLSPQAIWQAIQGPLIRLLSGVAFALFFIFNLWPKQLRLYAWDAFLISFWELYSSACNLGNSGTKGYKTTSGDIGYIQTLLSNQMRNRISFIAYLSPVLLIYWLILLYKDSDTPWTLLWKFWAKNREGGRKMLLWQPCLKILFNSVVKNLRTCFLFAFLWEDHVHLCKAGAERTVHLGSILTWVCFAWVSIIKQSRSLGGQVYVCFQKTALVTGKFFHLGLLSSYASNRTACSPAANTDWL